MAISVTLADDDLFVREGLVALLDDAPGIDVRDVCVDLDDLLVSVEANPPDVVLTDIRMPPTLGDEGIQAARRLRDTHPDVGVIVLSQYDDPAYALALLADGSERRGYLLKQRVSEPGELMAAIEAVAGGGSVIDPAVVDALVARQAPTSPLRFLTDRELEVVSHMAQGKDNAAIADSLYISQRAVEKHNNSIFAKLGLTVAERVDKRVQAVLLFLDRSS
jgi:DNA-binding NarL/FixJ family response regulator